MYVRNILQPSVAGTFDVLGSISICLKRFGYVDCVITINDLIDRSDHELFKKLCSPNHSPLYHLLPPYRTTNLRLRGHPFRLPEYCTDLHKKSFIV